MEEVKLGDVFEFIRNGASIKQDDSRIGYPITRIETIANSFIDLDRMGYAGIEEIGKYEDYLLKDGDILMSHINSEKHLGKTAIYKNLNKKIIHGMNLLCLRPSRNHLYPKYAYYYFNYSQFKKQIPKITKKSVNQASFSVNDLKLLNINIPKLRIQEKIADTLDKAQEIINKKKAQIEALDELVKSKFIEMFGDPIANSMNWSMKPLGELCFMKAGKGIKANDIYEINDGNMYPCYGGNGVRGYVQSFTHEGDIPLIGRQGALCGNVQFAHGKFYATEHAVVTQPAYPINVTWLYIMLREMNLNRLASGAAQPGLNVGTLVPLEVIEVPLELQNQFAAFVNQVDKLKFEMQRSLKELENNFDSLMQKAFNGELFT